MSHDIRQQIVNKFISLKGSELREYAAEISGGDLSEAEVNALKDAFYNNHSTWEHRFFLMRWAAELGQRWPIDAMRGMGALAPSGGEFSVLAAVAKLAPFSKNESQIINSYCTEFIPEIFRKSLLRGLFDHDA
jgi:hypothetical protein